MKQVLQPLYVLIPGTEIDNLECTLANNFDFNELLDLRNDQTDIY